MKKITDIPTATPETVWASLQDLSKKLAETDRLMKENERILNKQIAENTRLIKANSREIGGISKSNGEVAESYFVNSFTKNLNFAGQVFESLASNVNKNVKRLNLKDEFDLVLYNCTSVVIIEIKYKAAKDDVEQVLKKAETFKQLFPEYKDFNIYLGLAGLHVNKDAEKKAIKNGIAVIKQVGKNMVIYDEHLKVF